MSKNEKNILSEIKRGLMRCYGRRLVEIILYGSRARQKAEKDSDFDILVVLKDITNISRERKKCSDFIYRLCLKYNAVVMCHFMNLERYLSEQSPYLLNIRREGIEL